MAAKKRIFVSQKKLRDQNLKNLFPEGILQEDILFKNGGQNEFCDRCTIRPIYAN